MKETSTPTAPAADKKVSAMADAKAAFEGAMKKNGVPDGQPARAAPEVDRRVPPEEIWKERAKAPPPSERERDENGKFVAKVEAGPDSDAPKLRGSNEGDAKNNAEVDEEELARADSALVRSGFRKKELSTMPIAERLARGLKRAAALEADDEAHRIAKAHRSEKAGTSEEHERRGKAVSTEPAMPALDLDGVVKPLAKDWALDDERSSTLKTFANGLAEAVAKPLLKEIRSLKEQAANQVDAQEASLLNGARKELVGKFPQLAEPEVFKKTYERMQLRSNFPEYQDMPTLEARYVACLRDSCVDLKLDVDTDPEAERQTARSERDERKYARSTVTDRPKPDAATPKEREWNRFNDIMDKLQTS